MRTVCCDWSVLQAVTSPLGHKDCVFEIVSLCNRGKGWNSNKAFQAAEKSGFCRRVTHSGMNFGLLYLCFTYTKNEKHNRSALTSQLSKFPHTESKT